MDSELAQLEQKLASLLAHTRALRAANESLRRDLAAAVERNREMTIRVQLISVRWNTVYMLGWHCWRWYWGRLNHRDAESLKVLCLSVCVVKRNQDGNFFHFSGKACG